MTPTPPGADAKVPIRPPFTDARGEILNLVDAPFTSAAVITSVKGAVRGHHYHQTDYHYCWLQTGRMIYAHRPVGDSAAPQQWVITPGQLFYTPPMYEHVMQFTEDSVLFVFARNNREMAHYDADTIHVAPIIP
ncbi:MAG: hypothetical protein HY599_02005 [Candidatus Omnitrophica bacterium]|nr:hypothetical protein [Candidatus Omnitrophota bacterium]